MAVFLDSDFVNKEFSSSKESPAYYSYLGKKYYFIAKPGLNIGRIRAIVVNPKNGNKFFSVVSKNYPGKNLFFKYSDANFTDLVGQGVRSTKEKAKEDKQFEQDQNLTLWDKIQKPALIVLLGYGVVKLGQTYISSNAKR